MKTATVISQNNAAEPRISYDAAKLRVLVWFTEQCYRVAALCCNYRRDYYDSVGVWSGVIVSLSRDLYSEPMSVCHCVWGGTYATLKAWQSWLSRNLCVTSTYGRGTALKKFNIKLSVKIRISLALFRTFLAPLRKLFRGIFLDIYFLPIFWVEQD